MVCYYATASFLIIYLYPATIEELFDDIDLEEEEQYEVEYLKFLINMYENSELDTEVY